MRSSKPSPPRGLPRNSDRKDQPLATAFWKEPEELRSEINVQPNNKLAYDDGRIWIGRTDTDDPIPVGWEDNRHLLTIAGSRSGKGVSAIIPNLCEYPGSVICIDPKGENAFATAHRRGFGTDDIDGLNQDVRILCPFEVRHEMPEDYAASYNPLDIIVDPNNAEAIEDAGQIADALVVTSNGKDAHWDDSAKALLEGLILHVTSWPDYSDEERNLVTVRRLLMHGDEKEFARRTTSEIDIAGADTKPKSFDSSPVDLLFGAMMANPYFDGLVAGAATTLMSLSDREFSSIMSTARRNTKFLDSNHMQKALLSPEPDKRFSLDELKTNPDGLTIYLVLPARRMATHSRWMRLMLNLTVSRMEAITEDSATGLPILAILDEFPVLGHLNSIETAMGLMAGFGLRIWAFAQDLSQIKHHYPNSWETFIANSGLVQCFGNTDQTTIEYISKRLGETEIIRTSKNHSVTTSESSSQLSEVERLEKNEGLGAVRRTLGDMAIDGNTLRPSKSESTAISDTDSIMKTALMTPDEVGRYFSRDSGLQIILINDAGDPSKEPAPVYLRRTPYYEDDHFAGKYSS